MNLTLEKLQHLWSIKDQIFTKKSDIDKRFDTINEMFDKISDPKSKVNVSGNQLLIGNKEVTINEEKKTPSLNYFGPAEDDMPEDVTYKGVENMVTAFNFEDKEIIRNIGCLLGGFDFNHHIMEDKYRIISNAITSADDYKSLSSSSQYRHPSSHFADNNYFFNIMRVIQHFSKQNTYSEDIPFVLRYPEPKEKGKRYFVEEGDDQKYSKQYESQRSILKKRFPPKFLWMWANKNKVLHPVSLMAFRNFFETDFGKEISVERLVTIEFDDFPSNWQEISNKIFEKVIKKNFDQNNKDHQKWLGQLSKLISIISVEETDIKNIAELLITGHKAVILWGPPGTGKTFESMQVVKTMIARDQSIKDDAFENEYLFSKNLPQISNEHGYYDIIQFHPNHTYEDFIGGIQPKLAGDKLNYELKEGLFKKFCDYARESSEKFILIIDEINRAELSAVFGELLYALEYRNQTINLPHFGKFSIPDNVHIIGTMNNVDKSLVTFDLALRRRFSFFKLTPNLDSLMSMAEFDNCKNIDSYINRCKELNKQVKEDLELDEDCQIGQAYFKKIADFIDINDEYDITIFELEKLWEYNLYPLLEEYVGMRIDDDNVIKNQLDELKDKFILPL